MSRDAPERASPAERAYFERVGRQARRIDDERPPASLAEMFDRLERIRRVHGPLADPGIEGQDEGDLQGHLALLQHMRTIGRGGA